MTAALSEHAADLADRRPLRAGDALHLASALLFREANPVLAVWDRRLSAADWKLILPYLEENERLFGIQIERDLLSVQGVVRDPGDVYRKVIPRIDSEAEDELEGLGD